MPVRSLRRSLCMGVLTVSVTLLGGCAATFDETHYLASNARDSDGTPLNYYRLRVQGGTMLSSSRYISGWFDEDALDKYFNEIQQPTNGQLVDNGSNPDKSSDGTNANAAAAPVDGSKPASSGQGTSRATQQASPIGTEPNHTALMLILSSNSDAIAAGIGSIASTASTTQDLAALLAPKSTGVGKAQLTLAQGNTLAGMIQQMITGLGNSASANDTKVAMLDAANQIADYLGQPHFATLDDADKWLKAHGQDSLGGK